MEDHGIYPIPIFGNQSIRVPYVDQLGEHALWCQVISPHLSGESMFRDETYPHGLMAPLGNQLLDVYSQLGKITWVILEFIVHLYTYKENIHSNERYCHETLYMILVSLSIYVILYHIMLYHIILQLYYIYIIFILCLYYIILYYIILYNIILYYIIYNIILYIIYKILIYHYISIYQYIIYHINLISNLNIHIIITLFLNLSHLGRI